MSNEKSAAPKPTLEQWMAARHGLIAIVLLLAAAIFAGVALWQLILGIQQEPYLSIVGVWGFLVSLACLFGALYLKLADPADLARDETRYRLLALGLGGFAGLATFLLGIWLPLSDWANAFIPPTPKAGEEAAPLRHWRENWWRIMICATAVLGGLGLMFASLQLARHVERASAGMRRLLYGYNAVLTGLLLLASLALLNVLSYVQLPPFTVFDQQIDWTPSQMYTLSDKSESLLKGGLAGSVEIYALLSPLSKPGKDLETLVANCKRFKKDITLAFYSPDANPAEFQKIMATYGKHLEGDPFGVIVVYQTESGKEEAGGIRIKDLLSPRAGPDGGPSDRYNFKGENALMKLLSKLAESKPATIVFTKGHGEMELQGSFDRTDRGRNLALLKQRLESNRNYEFKEVTLGVEGNTGLADADVVVVAGPTRGYPPQAVQALRDYLNPRGTEKKGKMIFLLSTQVRNGEMLKTNLEDLLRENGVEISNKRILSVLTQPGPDSTPAVTPIRSPNPIARAFSNNTWLFKEPRRLSPARIEMSAMKAEPILVSDSDYPVWEESNLTASPINLQQEYFKPGLPKEQRPKFEAMMWLGVAVAESKPKAGMPRDAPHAGVMDQVPRMVVFGDSSWLASDRGARDGGLGADLFDSCVGWLRGKADLGRENYATDKERPEYSLVNKGLTKGSKLSRVVWLPLVLIFLAVLALGGGIWVVRRR